MAHRPIFPTAFWFWINSQLKSYNSPWSHCLCCRVVIPMLPFLMGHWWINEQVAKRQCNYIDGFSLQNERGKKAPSYAYKYSSFSTDLNTKSSQKNHFFFIYTGLDLHTLHLSWWNELVRIILAVQCHSLILGPIDLRDKAAVESHYEVELAACRDPGSQTRFNGGKSLS